MVQRVAVIGAGPSGLVSVKQCLDEGLQPTCFESSDDMGGLWKFKASEQCCDVVLSSVHWGDVVYYVCLQEVSEPNRASIYRSLTINISKEMMCYSDFPIPADYPNYMHHSKILNYFRMYAEHFKLLKYVRFQTSVKSVKQRPDYTRTGQWEVVTETKDGQEETHVFDAVICCSGHYTYPNLPLKDFPGIETFEGKYFHSWDYKGPEGMEGKRVVVIGIGNSGGDIAVESSRFAKQVRSCILNQNNSFYGEMISPFSGSPQVYMSTRRGAWVIRQVSDNGVPVDMKYNTRFVHILFQLLPMSVLNWIGEGKVNAMYDHTMYALKPKHRLFSQVPVINDDLPLKILSGSVIIKTNVKEIRGSDVIFSDGSVVEKVDVIVFATGYNYDFPYLPKEVMYRTGHRVGLYKHVFPPTLEHPTLAVVGFIHALGAIMTQAEMQARWVTRVFKVSVTNVYIRNPKVLMQFSVCRFSCSEHNPLQLFYIPYLDSLAKQVGVFPNLLWLFLTDPRLAVQVLFGPCTSYQYRLTGPGRWSGARQAILTQWDRVYQPFKTRVVPKPERKPKSKLKFTVILSGTALMFYLLYK
ncbi:hypothetical protein NL108_007019 [Boleophthalmus pectinirostris]|nr:hypothetical protein NL108_007019 [Boleophthalmus pectinirostris]